MTTELQQSQEEYNIGMRMVTAARNRVNRKAIIDDPAKRGAPQSIDEYVKRTSMEQLEVKFPSLGTAHKIYHRKNSRTNGLGWTN